jgi:charged multivesicular body protein 1
MDINQIGAVMDKFEASFDEADVRSQYVENAMNSSTASTMPEDAVESLLQQVSDEHGLQFASRAADASTAPVAMSAPTAALQESQEDALEKRLAALRSVG